MSKSVNKTGVSLSELGVTGARTVYCKYLRVWKVPKLHVKLYRVRGIGVDSVLHCEGEGMSEELIFHV